MNAEISGGLELQVATDDTDCPDRQSVERWAAMAWSMAGHGASFNMTVRLVDDAESQQLNAAYRGKDAPTNVLAFPSGEPLVPVPEFEQEIGDLIICLPVVRREAAEQGKTLSAHLTHLVVHGTLHLAGFDHEAPDDAEQMEQLEIKILSRLGVNNPYELDCANE